MSSKNYPDLSIFHWWDAIFLARIRWRIGMDYGCRHTENYHFLESLKNLRRYSFVKQEFGALQRRKPNFLPLEQYSFRRRCPQRRIWDDSFWRSADAVFFRLWNDARQNGSPALLRLALRCHLLSVLCTKI